MPPLYGLACVSARVPVSYRMAPERPRSHRVHFSGGSWFFIVSLGAGCVEGASVTVSGVERLGLVGTPLLRAGAAHRECPGDSGLGRVHEFGPSPLSSDSVSVLLSSAAPAPSETTFSRESYLVDPASSHMLVSKIKPCMSKFTLSHGETANGSLNQSRFLR